VAQFVAKFSKPRVDGTSVVNLDPGCPTQQQSRVLQLVLLLADVDIAIGRIQDVEHVIDQIGPVGVSMGAPPVVVKVGAASQHRSPRLGFVMQFPACFRLCDL
jgi:hypothetical protein